MLLQLHIWMLLLQLHAILGTCNLLVAYVPWCIARCGALCNFVSHLMRINLRSYGAGLSSYINKIELFVYVGCIFVFAIVMGCMLYML